MANGRSCLAGLREFRYQRIEQSSSQSFGALVRPCMHEAMPERYSTKKSYVSIWKRHILPQWGEAPVWLQRISQAKTFQIGPV